MSDNRTYEWIAEARIDMAREEGRVVGELRTAQRQLSIILSYWESKAAVRELTDLLKSGGLGDHDTFYQYDSEFSVQQWEPTTRSLVVIGNIAGYRLALSCSKDNFPGLVRTGSALTYEPNSLMPGFFLGQNRIRMTAYIQVERLNAAEREIFGGALCLVSSASTEFSYTQEAT